LILWGSHQNLYCIYVCSWMTYFFRNCLYEILIKILDILHSHIVTNYTYIFQLQKIYNINSYVFEWNAKKSKEQWIWALGYSLSEPTKCLVNQNKYLKGKHVEQFTNVLANQVRDWEDFWRATFGEREREREHYWLDSSPLDANYSSSHHLSYKTIMGMSS